MSFRIVINIARYIYCILRISQKLQDCDRDVSFTKYGQAPVRHQSRCSNVRVLNTAIQNYFPWGTESSEEGAFSDDRNGAVHLVGVPS